MNTLINTLKEFYVSQYGKYFVLAFFGYCFVAIFIPLETGYDLQITGIFWYHLLDFDPAWIKRFRLFHLPYYFPYKTLCFLGFPAIMGANLAAFFAERQHSINQTAVFCWAPFYPHPKSFYPEILDATINYFYYVIGVVMGIYFIGGIFLNKNLRNNVNKIHVQMLVTVFISVVAAIYLVVPEYHLEPCILEKERAALDAYRVRNDWFFMAHINPVVSFLFAYLGVVIMTRLLPALFNNDKTVT